MPPADVAFQVRAATDADLAGIAGLRRRWTEERLGRATHEGGFEERLGDWMRAQRRLTFLAERSAERSAERVSGHREAQRSAVGCSAQRSADEVIVIGMVNLAIFERMPSPERADSRWAYLANAYVRSEYRDRGVGTALVDVAVRAAGEQGCTRVVLAPTERSVPFYRRADFGPATMLMARVLDGTRVDDPAT